MPRRKTDRIGERFMTNEGYEVVVIEYNNCLDILVQFQDKYKAIVHTTINNCKNGQVKNPYHPSVYGVGYIGVGKYKSRENCNKKDNSYYEDWLDLLKRGFDNKYKEKRPTYKDVTVNEECFCLQNFGVWWENNYYEIEGEQMCIDKDILCKGNKEYSFNTMIFVPQRINLLFVKCDGSRGNLPIGVSYHKETNKYMARCQTLECQKYLGLYNTSEEAFLAYKEFKEQYIKQVADEYKDKIPQRLYDAMYAWTVEIDD